MEGRVSSNINACRVLNLIFHVKSQSKTFKAKSLKNIKMYFYCTKKNTVFPQLSFFRAILSGLNILPN